MFGKKNKMSGMDTKQLRLLDRRPVKYVTERDPESYREIHLGEAGGINIKENEFLIVCGGVNAVRCALDEVKVGELMNRSGITVKGYDLDRKREISVIAYYSDGVVKLA